MHDGHFYALARAACLIRILMDTSGIPPPSLGPVGFDRYPQMVNGFVGCFFMAFDTSVWVFRVVSGVLCY